MSFGAAKNRGTHLQVWFAHLGSLLKKGQKLHAQGELEDDATSCRWRADHFMRDFWSDWEDAKEVGINNGTTSERVEVGEVGVKLS